MSQGSNFDPFTSILDGNFQPGPPLAEFSSSDTSSIDAAKGLPSSRLSLPPNFSDVLNTVPPTANTSSLTSLTSLATAATAAKPIRRRQPSAAQPSYPKSSLSNLTNAFYVNPVTIGNKVTNVKVGGEQFQKIVVSEIGFTEYDRNLFNEFSMSTSMEMLEADVTKYIERMMLSLKLSDFNNNYANLLIPSFRRTTLNVCACISKHGLFLPCVPCKGGKGAVCSFDFETDRDIGRNRCDIGLANDDNRRDNLSIMLYHRIFHKAAKMFLKESQKLEAALIADVSKDDIPWAIREINLLDSLDSDNIPTGIFEWINPEPEKNGKRPFGIRFCMKCKKKN
jgi:hypothetical protein